MPAFVLEVHWRKVIAHHRLNHNSDAIDRVFRAAGERMNFDWTTVRSYDPHSGRFIADSWSNPTLYEETMFQDDEEYT